MSQPPAYLVRAGEMSASERTSSHPWNANSLLIRTSLSSLTGLRRTGVSIARIPPGKESFVYHSHEREEEWIFIISGKGKADIDGNEYEVCSGDFMGFPTPGVAHHLRNPFDDDLVYLMGGENLDIEIADFPTLGKRAIRYRTKDAEVFDYEDRKGFFDSRDGDR